MSDEEIRDLLDLGVDDVGVADGAPAQDLWAAGRRQRNRGRAWLGGLGAAAAAAGILGIVWGQGLVGGDTAPEPPADAPTDAVPGPVVDADLARGEPFLAVFHRAETEPPEQLSGTSVPATLEDLQGTWHGPDGEVFVFDKDQVTATFGGCSVERGTVELTPESRLHRAGLWEGSEDVGECSTDQPVVPWGAALNQEPLLSLDGETLLISGLDGTTEEPRVHVALTLGPVGENSSTWADVPSQTGVTPITLGPDVALVLTGSDPGLDSIHKVQLEDRPGAAQSAQGRDVEYLGYPGTCPLQLASSLRSDGILLADAPVAHSACTEGSEAPLPAMTASPAVVQLLRSGPTIDFDGDTLVISGTIPESMLEPATPEDTAPTSQEAEEPGGWPNLPEVIGTPAVVVMSEGDWAPTGELTVLTDEAATGKRWLPVTMDSEPPEVGADPSGDRGLSFDGTFWRIRDCGIDITVRGWLWEGVLTTIDEPEVVPDPDPGAACVFPLTPEDWVVILTGEPYLATDGEVLVIGARLGDGIQLEPVELALLPQGTAPEGAEVVRPVTPEDLAAGIVELPGQEAAAEVGVSDARDPQPGHATTITVADGRVSVDVGCAEPLTGQAWLSPSDNSQSVLRGVLPEDPDGCDGAAGDDAELWRQLLAHGVFLHHFGEHVIAFGWADPAVAGPQILP